jgi:hypothetical protein
MDALHELGVELKGLEGQPHLAREYGRLQQRIQQLADEVHALRRECTENTAMLESMESRIERLKKGIPDDPQAHIRHLDRPVKQARMRFARIAQAWAAISLSALLFAIVAWLLVAPRSLLGGLVLVTLVFIVTEAFLRGAFIRTVGQVTVVLAVLASIVLLLHFWFWLLIAGLLSLATFLLFQRLRELTG